MGREPGEGTEAGPPGRRKRPPLVSRRQAIDAAYVLIAREGPAGLSMRKLANALHVSLPTVYTAVDSRETLIGELQDRIVGEIAAAVAVERLAGTGTGLEDLAADLLSWAREHPQLAEFLIVEPMNASVAQRALQRASAEQRAGARALLHDLAGEPAPATEGPDPFTALAFVFAEVRAMLWLAHAEGPRAVDASTWLAIGCANVARGLSALAGQRASR